MTPRFSSSNGVEFARFGDVIINDYGIQVGSSWYSYTYTKGRPILLQAHYGGSNAHKVHQNLLTKKGDSSLFDVAEALYFDRILTEFDRRRVESYLGLKYSLNVTINATGLWKDYLASEGDSIWDSQTDKYFNQQILGLGHDTISRWYQVQTATNDSNKLLIAVDSLTYLGHQARVPLAPGSKAVFSLRSKRNWGMQIPCESYTGSPVIWEGWKFRLTDWGNVNTQFAVQLDGNLVSSGVMNPMVVLSSDGTYVEFLPVSQVGGSYRFNIPLDSIENEENYYIAMVDSGVVCSSQVIFKTVDEISCGNANGGSLTAFVSRNLLPAKMILRNDEGVEQVQSISSSSFEVSGLSKGGYELHLSNASGLLALSSFKLGMGCTCTSNSEWSIKETRDNISVVAENVLKVFPNPAKAGSEVHFELKGDEKLVRYSIYSGDGRLIAQNESSDPNWSYRFLVSGTYTVQCELENGTLTTQIIIQ
ncbi:MAG: T9SS type A sorting domain-containing protein [Candidatus Neomarinimicrobiota bacterium]